jgi:hypothetical protein
MTKKKWIYPALFVGCSVLLMAGAPLETAGRAETFTLKYEMAEGARFVVTGSNFFERETVLPDGGLTGNTIEHEFEGSFEVKSVDSAKGLNLNMVIRKITCEKNNPGGTFHESFPDMTGHVVDFKLSPVGDLSGLEVFNNLPQKDVLLRITDPSGFLHRAHNAFPHLPDNPVGSGDSWTFKMERERPAMRGARSLVSSEYTYKLIEQVVENGIPCVKIEVTYTQISRTEIETPRGPIVAEYTGQGAETILFAYTKGMFLSKKGTLDMEGSFGDSPQTDHIDYSYQTKFDR